MRFVDTNVFVTAMVDPVNDLERRKSGACGALFQRVVAGEEQIQTHDTIIAEVAYVLSRGRHFRLPPAETVRRLRPLIALPHLRLPNKRVMLRALDTWAHMPKLDFEDVLTFAYVTDGEDGELYSYDHDFDRLPGIRRVEPA